MQFGKFHGVALIALGVLLLMVQVYVIFAGRANVEPLNPSDRITQTEPGAATLHVIDYLPGAAGVGLVALGGFVLMLGQKKLLDEVQNREANRTHHSAQRVEKHG
jgi:predicted amino acid dehydrogenase